MCHNYWTIFHMPTPPIYQSRTHANPINLLFIITNFQIIKTLWYLRRANHSTAHRCN